MFGWHTLIYAIREPPVSLHLRLAVGNRRQRSFFLPVLALFSFFVAENIGSVHAFSKQMLMICCQTVIFGIFVENRYMCYLEIVMKPE
jgi:hypothetical protein